MAFNKVYEVRSAKDVDVIEKTINEKVSEGWEFVESNRENGETHLYFRQLNLPIYDSTEPLLVI